MASIARCLIGASAALSCLAGAAAFAPVPLSLHGQGGVCTFEVSSNGAMGRRLRIGGSLGLAAALKRSANEDGEAPGPLQGSGCRAAPKSLKGLFKGIAIGLAAASAMAASVFAPGPRKVWTLPPWHLKPEFTMGKSNGRKDLASPSSSPFADNEAVIILASGWGASSLLRSFELRQSKGALEESKWALERSKGILEEVEKEKSKGLEESLHSIEYAGEDPEPEGDVFYLGDIPSLVAEANARKGMSTQAVRSWLDKNGRDCGDQKLANMWARGYYAVDHYISTKHGGRNHPCNFVIMSSKKNQGFGRWNNIDKKKWVGKRIDERATDFAKWCCDNGDVDYSNYNNQPPV